MIVKTETDGTVTTVSISDSGKYFEFEIEIWNAENGKVMIDYVNSERDTYNLLTVEDNGAIINEVPTLQ